MTEISGKSLHEIYKEDARKYKESIEKDLKAKKRNATDKLSVEKLQEHLLPYKKETVQKIRDEKMQLVTADEFLKLHKESLTAIRENDKLQEQLNTAKKALTESEKKYQKQMDRFLNSEMNESARSHCESQLKLLFPAHKAYEALAAFGGDDE